MSFHRKVRQEVSLSCISFTDVTKTRDVVMIVRVAYILVSHGSRANALRYIT